MRSALVPQSPQAQTPLAWRKNPAALSAAVVCPDCRVPLLNDENGLRCSACGVPFESLDGVPKLWPPSRAPELEKSIASFKSPHQGVRQSSFFRGLLPPSPVCDPDRPRRNDRVKNAMNSGLIVNLGSKSADWGSHVVNLDLVMPAEGASNVDLLGDIQRLPFADNSVDGVICTYVLEHVADARACMDEIARVIKPGGHVYITVPFLFPTHPDPLDRWRWTLDGLRFSLSAFSEVEAGTSGGPFSAYVAIVPTLTASLFSHFYLFNGIRFFLGWLLWPLKFLDLLAWRSKKAYMAASNFYFWGRKR